MYAKKGKSLAWNKKKGKMTSSKYLKPRSKDVKLKHKESNDVLHSWVKNLDEQIKSAAQKDKNS